MRSYSFYFELSINNPYQLFSLVVVYFEPLLAAPAWVSAACGQILAIEFSSFSMMHGFGCEVDDFVIMLHLPHQLKINNC